MCKHALMALGLLVASSAAIAAEVHSLDKFVGKWMSEEVGWICSASPMIITRREVLAPDTACAVQSASSHSDGDVAAATLICGGEPYNVGFAMTADDTFVLIREAAPGIVHPPETRFWRCPD